VIPRLRSWKCHRVLTAVRHITPISGIMSTSSANPTTARNLTHPTEHHSPSQAFDAILSNQSTNTNPKPLQLQHVLEEHPHKTIMGASRPSSRQTRNQIAKILHDRTIERLRECHVDTSTLGQERFSWLSPEDGHVQDSHVLALYETWMRNPMLITDHDLQSMIAIKPSTAASPKPSNGRVGYIRSWEMKAAELDKLIRHIRQSGKNLSEVDRWAHATRVADSDTILTIRYVA